MLLKCSQLIVFFSLSFASVLCDCGVPAGGQSLVVNGQNFRRGNWPWMVALFQKSDAEDKFFCGGVLVAQNKILTAAHCIQEKYQGQRNTRDIVLRIGAYDLSDRNEIGVFITTPNEVIIHPEWNPSNQRYDADIAAILLEENVPLTKFIKPVCIGTANLEINEGVVTGWGKSEDKSKVHENIPKELKVPIWTNEQCFLEDGEFSKIGSARTLCAGGRDNSGPCNGKTSSL